jgi:hypothetical protein
MAREEYVLGDEQQPASTTSGPLLHLPFDKARYALHKPPCQALVASFYASGIDYLVMTHYGCFISVTKKQTQAMMELGRFAWIVNANPCQASGTLKRGLQIEFSEELTNYRPFFTERMNRASVEQFKDLAHLMKLNNRKHSFVLDPVTGLPSNLYPRVARGDNTHA